MTTLLTWPSRSMCVSSTTSSWAKGAPRGSLVVGTVWALGWATLVWAVANALLTSFLPTLMLSGFIFPISSMPEFLQLVTRIVPARYFLVALRGIVLKGVGPDAFWSDLVALGIFAVAILGLASLRLGRQWA